MIPFFVARLRNMFIATSLCFCATVSIAQSKSIQRVDLMVGQGLVGYSDLSFDLRSDGELWVNIDAMNLSYSEGAEFNNFDDGYAGAEVVGFMSVLRNDDQDAEPVDRSMTEIGGTLDDNGSFACANCGSFVLTNGALQDSTQWTSAIVVGNVVFFNGLQIPASLLRE